MRVSNLQFYNSGLNNILRAQSNVVRSQEEVATGKRILQPADDPAGATLAQKLRQDLELNEQYLRNMDVADRELQQQESILYSVEEALVRLRELTVQAGNDALDDAQRTAIMTEAEVIYDELLGYMNTRGASGEYLFSGSKGSVQPFQETAQERVEYTGDQVGRALEIAPGTTVNVRDNGYQLFVDIPAAEPAMNTRAELNNTGSATIGTGQITDQATWEGVYDSDLILQYDAGINSFYVFRRNHATGNETLDASIPPIPYTSGDAISLYGTEVSIAGAPADGDRFTLVASETQPLLTTVRRFIDGLEDSLGGGSASDIVAATLANLDEAETHILTEHASIGSRMNVVEDVRATQEDQKILNTELISDLEDVDYNEAISRLQQETFVLQASQQSFARISGLSLFNYL